MTVHAGRSLSSRAGAITISPASARAIVVVLALAHATAAWLLRTPGFGWGEDDAGYLLLAQDLRHFSYREIQDVLAPVHARFPPVFPLLLSLVGAPFGDRLDVLLAFVALCSAASVLFLFEGARRVVGDEVAILASVLYAVNPSAVWDAGNLMAEAPFKLFLLVALWALTRQREGTRFAVIAGAATMLAALTRMAGVVFVPALIAYWVFSREYKRALVFGAAAAALVGGWLGYSFAAPDPENHRLYVSDIGLRGRRAPSGVLEEVVRRIAPRLRRFATMFPFVLALPTVAGTIVDNVLWVLSLVAFGVTGMVVLLRRWLAAALFLAAYVGLLVIWRYALERFINPIVPLLYLALLAGIAWWGKRLFSERGRLLVFAASLLLLVGAYPRNATRVQRLTACDRAHPESSAACWPSADGEYLRLAKWVRDSTPREAIVFVSKERAFFVHSGRKSINQDRGLQEDSASLGPYLRSRGVSFSAVSPVGVRSQQHNALVAKACRDFAIVRHFSERTILLRVRAESEPPDAGETCAALRAALPPPTVDD